VHVRDPDITAGDHRFHAGSDDGRTDLDFWLDGLGERRLAELLEAVMENLPRSRWEVRNIEVHGVRLELKTPADPDIPDGVREVTAKGVDDAADLDVGFRLRLTASSADPERLYVEALSGAFPDAGGKRLTHRRGETPD
jgi:hypothetical protein